MLWLWMEKTHCFHGHVQWLCDKLPEPGYGFPCFPYMFLWFSHFFPQNWGELTHLSHEAKSSLKFNYFARDGDWWSSSAGNLICYIASENSSWTHLIYLFQMVIFKKTNMFFQILGIIIPVDFHMFQRGCNHHPVVIQTLFRSIYLIYNTM